MPRLPALIALICCAGLTAGCERKAPQPAATATPPPAATALPPATPSPIPTPKPVVAPSPVAAAPALDIGALNERKDPARLLRYYAAALAAGDWSAASRAWGKGSGVTAATLRAAYNRPERPRLEIGSATVEGGAGSLYYEAPVILRFGGAPAERGTLILRRVNDVDGATAEQLRWHIERSTIGAGQ